VVVEHVQVRRGTHGIGLRCRSVTHRGYRCRSRNCTGVNVVMLIVTILERLEQQEMRKLGAQLPWVSAEVVDHDSGSLLIFGEIATLKKAIRTVVGIHIEVGYTIEFHGQASWSCYSIHRLTILQGDVLDGREWELDLVASVFVVDIVCQTWLFANRVEDDKVHCVLSDPAPSPNAE